MVVYIFNKFLTEKNAIEADLVEVYSDNKIGEDVFDLANEINKSIRLAKAMVDEPANIMTPEEIAKVAKESLEGSKVEVEIFESEEIEKLGMNLFMNVAKGAENKPRLIVMRYFANPNSKEIVGLMETGSLMRKLQSF